MIPAAVSLFLAVLLLAACSSSAPSYQVAPDPDPVDTLQLPVARKTYDEGRGGAQLTAIYYNQGTNSERAGINDEWIIIESRGDISTAGWMLDAGDANQRYALPDAIHGRLYVYTHAGPAGGTNDTTFALNLAGNRWIWNNAEPDTARLYDGSGAVIDIMTYKGK